MKNELKKGDWIKCHDDKEVRDWLEVLSKEDYGATRGAGNYILITAEPRKENNGIQDIQK